MVSMQQNTFQIYDIDLGNFLFLHQFLKDKKYVERINYLIKYSD